MLLVGVGLIAIAVMAKPRDGVASRQAYYLK